MEEKDKDNLELIRHSYAKQEEYVKVLESVIEIDNKIMAANKKLVDNYKEQISIYESVFDRYRELEARSNALLKVQNDASSELKACIDGLDKSALKEETLNNLNSILYELTDALEPKEIKEKVPTTSEEVVDMVKDTTKEE